MTDWSSLVVGIISPWIDIEAKDEKVQKNSIKVRTIVAAFSIFMKK